MIAWLLPISLFWTLAAMYLGGAAIKIEGGGGWQQTGGLLLSFVLFLAVWVGLRAALGSFMGDTGAVVIAAIVASILLTVIVRVSFRILGVRITKDDHGHTAHAAAESTA